MKWVPSKTTMNAGVAKELRVQKTQRKFSFLVAPIQKSTSVYTKSPTVRVLLGHVQHATPDLNSTCILTVVAVGASVASSTFT